MYPTIRMRRLRKAAWLRDLVAECSISPKDLIQPFFVIEGDNLEEPIDTLPGISRFSIDVLVKKVKRCAELGIKAIALFPSVSEDLKDELGTEAHNKNNLVCRAVKAIKQAKIDIGVICDVALDPYTSHRHDGIVNGGDVDNDLTISALVNQAIVLADAGADIVAPSDMMDGRILSIREALDEAGYQNVVILSYAIKYVSNLYGPFRDAVRSKTAQNKELSKTTYQADYRRDYREALKESELDISEGADIVMIKPAMFYLDIISNVADVVDVPVFAFQVSGEYAMIKFSAKAGALSNEMAGLMESLVAIKRSGARAILTYGAMEVAEYLVIHA